MMGSHVWNGATDVVTLAISVLTLHSYHTAIYISSLEQVDTRAEKYNRCIPMDPNKKQVC